MLRSLHRRPRGRAPARLLSVLTGGRVPAGPDPRLLAVVETRPVADYDTGLQPPTEELVERLPPVEDVAERLDPPLAGVLESAEDPAERARLALVLSAHAGVALERTGLSSAVPPHDVHAMTRGPLAAGGDPWLADLVVGALERAGAELPAGARVLDFGCSSARVLRILAAWREDVTWLGCDPNADAIAWASEHLDGIELFASPQDPPLQLAQGTLDAVYAISVWSHFGAAAAERWLAEMHRVLRPGGVLVLTAQGLASVAHYLREEAILAGDAARCTEALVSEGHWFERLFGADGDWGVAHPEWGMAYFTPEWLLARATPRWSLDLYEPGRLDGNQDLYVLRRR